MGFFKKLFKSLIGLDDVDNDPVINNPVKIENPAPAIENPTKEVEAPVLGSATANKKKKRGRSSLKIDRTPSSSSGTGLNIT